jgi:acyl carrier protein
MLAGLFAGKELDFCLIAAPLGSALGITGEQSWLDDCGHESRAGRTRWIGVAWDGCEPDPQGNASPDATLRETMRAEEAAEVLLRILASGVSGQIFVSPTGIEQRIAKAATRQSIVQAGMQTALTAAIHPRPETGIMYVAPVTDSERAIAEILQDLLGIDRVGMHDQFVDLGGHSLLSLQVLARIEARLGVRLTQREVLVETVGRLAETCAERNGARPARRSGPAESAEHKQDRKLAVAQPEKTEPK